MCGAPAVRNAAEGWNPGGVFVREESIPSKWDGAWPEHKSFCAECTCCGLSISAGTLDAAVKYWNRRPEPGKPTYYQEHVCEQAEAAERLKAAGII